MRAHCPTVSTNGKHHAGRRPNARSMPRATPDHRVPRRVLVVELARGAKLRTTCVIILPVSAPRALPRTSRGRFAYRASLAPLLPILPDHGLACLPWRWLGGRLIAERCEGCAEERASRPAHAFALRGGDAVG